MDNDYAQNEQKMVEIGAPLKTRLLNLKKPQKLVERVDVKVRVEVRLADHVREMKQLAVARKRKRGERRNFSSMCISAAEAEAMQPELVDEPAAAEAEEPGDALEDADGLPRASADASPLKSCRVDEEPAPAAEQEGNNQVLE